jgi:hypothetical protein
MKRWCQALGWLLIAFGLLLFGLCVWEGIIHTNPPPDLSPVMIAAVGSAAIGIVLKLLGPQ